MKSSKRDPNAVATVAHVDALFREIFKLRESINRLTNALSAKPEEESSGRLGYTVEEAVETGAFPTRNKAYEAIARGDVMSWKDGRSRVISAQSLREYTIRRARDGEKRNSSSPMSDGRGDL